MCVMNVCDVSVFLCAVCVCVCDVDMVLGVLMMERIAVFGNIGNVLYKLLWLLLLLPSFAE